MTELTSQTENYLKAIWSSSELADEPVTIGALAMRLGLAPSSVSEAIRKLAAIGLVSHAPYSAIELTEQGSRAAVGIVRKHRLMETFLVDYLGYSWDEVHDEAEILEHAVSDRFVDRLAVRLGNPTRDPHGDPIPNADGTMPVLSEMPLDHAAPGSTVRIVRVSDSDSGLLRRLELIGLGLDALVTVGERGASEYVVPIEYGGSELDLARESAASIRVQPV